MIVSKTTGVFRSPFSVEGFYRYFIKSEEEVQYEKQNILHKEIESDTYFTNFVEKVFDNEKEQKCQLILVNRKDGSLSLGFALQTKGFPLQTILNKLPLFNNQVPLQGVNQFFSEENILIFKMKDHSQLWKFKFQLKGLLKKWVQLVSSLFQNKDSLQQPLQCFEKRRQNLSDIYPIKQELIARQKSLKVVYNSQLLQPQHKAGTSRIIEDPQTLKMNFKKKEEEIENLSAKNHETTKKNHQLQQEIQIKDFQINELKQKNRIYGQQLAIKEDQIKRMLESSINNAAFEQTDQAQKERQSYKSSLELQIKTLQSKVLSLQKHNHDLNSTKQNFEEELTMLRQNLEKQITKEGQFIQKAKQKESKIQILQQNQLLFQEQLQKLSSQKRETEQKLHQQMEKCQKITDQIFNERRKYYQIDHSLKETIEQLSKTKTRAEDGEKKFNVEQSKFLDQLQKSQRFQQQVQRMQRELKNKDQECQKVYQKKDDIIAELNKTIQNLKNRYQIKEKEQQQNKTSQQDMLKLINLMKYEKKDLEKRLDIKDETIENSRKFFGEYQRSISCLEEKLKKNQEQLQRINKQKRYYLLRVSDQEERRIIFEEKHKQKYEQLVQKSNELVQKEEQNIKLKNQNAKLQSLIQESQQANQSQKNSWKNSEQALKDQISHEVEKNKVLRKQNQTLSSQVEEARKEITAIRKERDDLFIKKEQLEDQYNRFELSTASQLLQHQENTKKKGVQFEQLMVEHEKMKEFYSRMEKQLSYFKSRKGQSINPILFHGNMISDLEEEKIFIKNEVEKVKQKSILKTKLIFFTDPFNSTSFHKYVDQIPDIVLIVKTESGMYFGGYSESPIKKEEKDKKENKENPEVRLGILMSITNRKVFPLIKGKRPVTYDNYFMIFGNSEIRLKQGETKVFSNFGIANGFYSPQGSSINDILGGGKEREVKIVGFEVHRVFFCQ